MEEEVEEEWDEDDDDIDVTYNVSSFIQWLKLCLENFLSLDKYSFDR